MSGDGFTGFGKLASIEQSQVAGRNANEMINTVLTVPVYHARGVNDFIGRTHGRFLFDNSNTIYSSLILPPALMDAVNASIARCTATPDANAWLDNNYEPTGRLLIPMLTLHNRFDPLAPFGHEAAYHHGHCNFGAALTVTTVQDLVNWVTTGVPALP